MGLLKHEVASTVSQRSCDIRLFLGTLVLNDATLLLVDVLVRDGDTISFVICRETKALTIEKGSAMIWNVDTSECVLAFSVIDTSAHLLDSIACSKDGSMLLTTSREPAAKI